MTYHFINKPLGDQPGRRKPPTNKEFETQGWNAKEAGIKIEDCPYYPTSTAEKYWKKGWRSV
jgi:ribosome modulation factor